MYSSESQIKIPLTIHTASDAVYHFLLNSNPRKSFNRGMRETRDIEVSLSQDGQACMCIREQQKNHNTNFNSKNEAHFSKFQLSHLTSQSAAIS